MRKAFVALILVIAFSTAVYAENETAPPDPCAGVTCNSPPATTCEGSSVKTYSSSGTCSGGTCSYSSTLTDCPNGCDGGQCKSAPQNFCDTATCTSNSRTCPDGFAASCTNTCDRAAQSCTTCEPSCEGHDAPAAPTNTSSGGGTSNSDPACAGVVCNSPPAPFCDGNIIKTHTGPGTCSNGQCSYYVSSTPCPNACSNGQCVDNPAGTSGGVTCTDSDGGKNYFVKGTVEHKWPDQQPQIQTDSCSSPTSLIEKYCASDGGRTEYYTCSGECRDGACVEGAATNGSGSGAGCLEVPTLGVDGSGRCSKFPNSCLPPGWRQVSACPTQTQQCQFGCECKFDDMGNVISSYCPTQGQCNNDNRCDKGEEYGCGDCTPSDTKDCPVTKQCPDGSSVQCQRTEKGCLCEQCQLQDVPPGCTQINENGFTRVICDKPKECPPVPQDVRLKCADEGGTPKFGRDSNGCSTFQCDFGGDRGSNPVFATPVKCPSPEEVSQSLKKCESLGMPGVIGFEGGCKIGKCINEEMRRRECPNPTREEKMSLDQKCRSEGLELVFEFDGECNQPKCGKRQGSGCQKEMPKEAYDKCAADGGQLVVRRNQDGCVSYSNCLRRGNSEESFVDEIDEVPETTELLSIAFKLEDLKLEFDKLSKKTNDIAEYYKSTGSSEEKRFRRVSDMFGSAKDKVDEVKNKLKNMASDITKDDVLEIKQDLRYLKDVVLKDILFVMLGSGDEIEEIKSGTTKECGTDGSCFDRAIRVCQPVTFRPEGRNGPIIELKGLEGDACILYAKLPEGQGPPGQTLDMTCKITKYSLGVRNPETDIFPYCTGSMVDMIKKYGTEGPGVPGKCSGDKCQEYCGRGPAEAKECLEYLGDMLPEDAKQHLTELASGKAPRGFGGNSEFQGGDFNEGEFENDYGNGGFQDEFQGGGQLCPDGICDDFEQKNPNACPQDCGGTSGSGGGFAQSQPRLPQQPLASGEGGGGGACSGCLNNGVCDPGECSECKDCI